MPCNYKPLTFRSKNITAENHRRGLAIKKEINQITKQINQEVGGNYENKILKSDKFSSLPLNPNKTIKF